MAIFQRQFEKLLSHEMLRHMIGRGTTPNAKAITASLRKQLDRKRGTLYRFVPQRSKSVFANTVYNDSLVDIKFDIDLLHEELLDLFGNTLRRFNFADLYHKVHSHELNNLKDLLDSLLFTVEDADFYFLSAFDNFTDTTKLDFKESTKGIVDLSENAVLLPYGGRNTQRIDTSHLFDKTSWHVNVVRPTGESIVKRGHSPSGSFGNMFADLINAWVYEVVSAIQGPVEVSFRFPLAGSPKSEAEVFLNRIELVPHSGTKQHVTVKLSSDDVNYLSPTGYEDGLSLEDARRVYALDFETTLTQYVEITLRKDSPDDELVGPDGQKQFQYLFGLKAFSALSTGRIESGRYQSKPFTFGDEDEKISRVSLRSEFGTPPGTSLSFSVALANEDKVVSDFLPIVPLDRGGKIGETEVINFGTTVGHSRRISVKEDASAYGTPFKGKQLYRLGDAVLPTPIFGTGKLFRGFRVWYRDSSRGFQVVEENDEWIFFGAHDLESLYTTTTELLGTGSIVNNFGEAQTKLEVGQEVYFDSSRGHALKPDPGKTRANADIQPNYAVYRVLQKAEKDRFNIVFNWNKTRTHKLPSRTFIVQTTDSTKRPKITDHPGTLEFKEGTDFTYVTEDVGGVKKPIGDIKVIPNSTLDKIGKNTQLRFHFTHDPDVTHKVNSISGNFITMRHSEVPTDQSIQVTYRYIPVSPSEIIKASIRVKNLPNSASSGIIRYVEGQDYVVDPRTGAIQRVPTGSIPSNSGVYVDFQFRNAEEGIETFLTWCHIADSEGAQIKFDLDPSTKKNKLKVDKDLGEAFFANTPQGLVDLTNASQTPVLERGWIQFIVRSKNPDANKKFQTNLIDQIIQLRDEGKRKVFKERSTYFDQIIAFREPMVQRTVNHLKVNTLPSDHTAFAIDTDTDPKDPVLVVAFEPNKQDELYLKIPTEDHLPDEAPATLYEIYRLNWESKQTKEEEGNQLVVRVDLLRGPDVDGGLTPKVFGYTLRASL